MLAAQVTARIQRALSDRKVARLNFMHPYVYSRREQLADVCQRLGVRRLEVFGSAATEHFDPLRSDVDLLVQFDETSAGPLDEYFGLKTQLEAVFSRPADLLISGSVRNPYVLAGIEASRKLVYAALPASVALGHLASRFAHLDCHSRFQYMRHDPMHTTGTSCAAPVHRPVDSERAPQHLHHAPEPRANPVSST